MRPTRGARPGRALRTWVGTRLGPVTERDPLAFSPAGPRPDAGRAATGGESGTPPPTAGHLSDYRHEIDDGLSLAEHADEYRHVFNTIRPHEALDWKRPLDVHLEACNDRQTIKSNEPETLPLS